MPVLLGFIITAEGGAVVIMENAVFRSTPNNPFTIADNVLVGSRVHLTGHTVGNNVFLATGSSVFTDAHIGTGAGVRINGVVSLKTFIPPMRRFLLTGLPLEIPVKSCPPTNMKESGQSQNR